MISDVQSLAVFTAIEEVALGALGSIRTVPAGTLARDAYQGIGDRTLAERVLVKPRVEVALVGVGRSKVIAPATASKQLYDLELKITLALTTEHEVREDERRATRAEGLALATQVIEALTWPGNLAQTVAGSLTGLISRCLHWVGPAKVVREDFKKRVFVLELPARGRVLASAAVT